MAAAKVTMLVTVLVMMVARTGAMCPAQCSCEARTVRCHGGELSHVPHFLDPDTEELDVAGNMILKLEAGLTFYSRLLSVNISGNSLRSLGRDQFMSQTSLASLDLSRNLVSKIRVGAFNGLESLVSLNMRENRIERLSSAVFTGLVSLQILDLGFNNISVIEEDAFRYLRQLQVLVLRRNSLVVVSGWTAPLLSLSVLDLAQNLIQQISPDISLNSVEEVNLSDNMLVELGEASVSGLGGVRRLDLSYNKLSSVPGLASLGPSLQQLSVSGNMVKQLTQESLHGLTSLQVLEAANMPLLTSVSPLAFLSLSNLSRVSLATNRRLAPLPGGVWAPCPLLQHLDLSSAPWPHLAQDQLPSNPTKIIIAGMPLECSCSLVWLWELAESGEVVEGAQCDGQPLTQVSVDSLACHALDWGLVVGCSGGAVAVIILAVMAAAVAKCCRERRLQTKYLQCDYLQYTCSPNMEPAAKYTMEAGSSKAGHASPPLQHQQIYAEIDKFYPGAAAGDQQIYCTVQDPAAGPSWTPGNQQLYHGHQLYSSSGSASSDQNTSSTDYSLAPLSTVSSYCSPSTPRRLPSTSVYPDQGHHLPHHASPGHPHPQYPAATLQYNPAAFSAVASSPQFSTQKKRTLVQYKYPDILHTSDNKNQNYYV